MFLGEASRRIQREMKLGTWNVRSVYRAGSFKAAARELARYQVGVVGVHEVRWDKRGISRRLDVRIWTGLGWHRIGTGGGRL